MQPRHLTVLLGMSALLMTGTPKAAAQSVPLYRVTVVARTTPAINYRHRGGSTTIDFRGTPLLPKARGEAKVESKQGYTEIEVEFDNLVAASDFAVLLLDLLDLPFQFRARCSRLSRLAGWRSGCA